MEVNGAPELLCFPHSSEYVPLCSAEQRHSYRFGTTWGWVNDDRIFIFGRAIPLSPRHTENNILILYVKMWVKLYKLNIYPVLYLTHKYMRQANTHTHTHTHTPHTHSHTFSIPVLFSLILTSLSISRFGPWNRGQLKHVLWQNTHKHTPSQQQTFSIVILLRIKISIYPSLPPPTFLLTYPSCTVTVHRHISPASVSAGLLHSPIHQLTLARRPIWSSARVLLVLPGVLVGSLPSPSTPGHTFRSCMPCRNILVDRVREMGIDKGE